MTYRIILLTQIESANDSQFSCWVSLFICLYIINGHSKIMDNYHADIDTLKLAVEALESNTGLMAEMRDTTATQCDVRALHSNVENILRLANPITVYADLIASGDPGNLETAQLLRDEYITEPDRTASLK